MLSKFRVVLGVAALGVAAATGASAHHSTAMYDFQNTKVIEGAVKQFLWINPHCMLWVVVPAADGKPEETWQIENTSPGRLSLGGWKKTTFKPGDKVKVTLRPLRDGRPGGFFTSATMVDTGEVVNLAGITYNPENEGKPAPATPPAK